jgi:hypothetical protein
MRIKREIAARTEGKLSLGVLYGSINKMLELELIEESTDRPDPHLDDERRRYYRITPYGRKVAQAEAGAGVHDIKMSTCMGAFWGASILAYRYVPGSGAATGIGFFAGATPGAPLCRTSALLRADSPCKNHAVSEVLDSTLKTIWTCRSAAVFRTKKM